MRGEESEGTVSKSSFTQKKILNELERTGRVHTLSSLPRIDEVRLLVRSTTVRVCVCCVSCFHHSHVNHEQSPASEKTCATITRPSPKKGLTCRACNLTFESIHDQRKHFRTPEHVERVKNRPKVQKRNTTSTPTETSPLSNGIAIAMKVTHLNRPPKVVFRLRVKESDIKLTVWRALISDTKQIKLSDGKKLNQSEWSPRLVETVLRVPESSCCVRVYFCTAYPFHTLKLKHTYRYSYSKRFLCRCGI